MDDAGWRAAEEAKRLAERWQPPAPPSDFSFPIRPDTGLRELREWKIKR